MITKTLKGLCRLVEEDDDLMSMDEWIDCVRGGGFVDYDGYGNVSDGKYKFKWIIKPSDLNGVNLSAILKNRVQYSQN
jgi:hypothetical protein